VAANYVLLDRIELNASAASIVFDNIPQSGYTDLKVVASVATGTQNDLVMQFNGVTTGYTWRLLEGNGASAASYNGSTGRVGLVTQSTTIFSNAEVYIPNYRGSSNKSYSADAVSEANATTAYADLTAGLWSNTAAITSINLSCAGSFVANSTFSLYGLAQVGTTPAIAPKADGGNVIGTDGTYWYHAFLSNGTFTPQVGLSAEVLVIGGGGGGGHYVGGGGGAGGYQVFTSQSLVNATSYACTVGAGGVGGTSSASSTNGILSQFGALTSSIGGGGGSNYGTVLASSGASGGGGTAATGFYTGGTGTQGFNGGDGGGASLNYPAGGGGGSAAVGQNGIGSTTGGAGGAGKNSQSAWATATGTGVSGFYAGGGGGGVYNQVAGSGGAGGSGGGGTAGAIGGNNPGAAGVVNTGSGGGGASGTSASPKADGGAGGSGIVIIRYLVA
jgi:hypothetical protein